MSEVIYLMVEMVYTKLTQDIQGLQTQIDDIRSSASGQIEAYAYADLPTGNTYKEAFVTNGRKPAEGAGLGTGIPAWRNPSNGVWYSFTGSVVTI